MGCPQSTGGLQDYCRCAAKLLFDNILDIIVFSKILSVQYMLPWIHQIIIKNTFVKIFNLNNPDDSLPMIPNSIISAS